MPEMEEVQVIGADGRIICNEEGEVYDRRYGGEALAALRAEPDESEKGYAFVLSDGKYHLFLPIHDKEGHRIGSLGLIFDAGVVDDKTRSYFFRLVTVWVLLAPWPVLLMVFLFPRMVRASMGGKGEKTAVGGIVCRDEPCANRFGLLELRRFS